MEQICKCGANRGVCVDCMAEKIESLTDALLHAVRIIESYETDIRTAMAESEYFKDMGFCQIYRDAISEIEKKSGGKIL